MAIVTTGLGSRTQLGSGMGTLATNTYLNMGTLTFNTNKPLDVQIEVTATNGASTGYINVFAQKSLDGTNFETGPTSGSTATDEPVLTPIGSVPLTTNSTLQTKVFSLAQAFGTMPYAAKIIVRNTTGASLSSGTVYYSEVTTTVA